MTVEAMDAALLDSFNTRMRDGFANCPDLDTATRSKEFALLIQTGMMMIAANPDADHLITALTAMFLRGVACGRADAEARTLEGLL